MRSFRLSSWGRSPIEQFEQETFSDQEPAIAAAADATPTTLTSPSLDRSHIRQNDVRVENRRPYVSALSSSTRRVRSAGERTDIGQDREADNDTLGMQLQPLPRRRRARRPPVPQGGAAPGCRAPWADGFAVCQVDGKWARRTRGGDARGGANSRNVERQDGRVPERGGRQCEGVC